MSSPQQNRGNQVVITDEESRRVRAFIHRVGFIAAGRRLGVGDSTLEAARDRGRMQDKTRDRLLAALAREEAAIS